MTHRTSAFTLIELLIVVAIIAILAAIAVPNFLEAQTRASGSAELPVVVRLLNERKCRDVLDAVQTSVNPKVIDCPDAASGKSTLSAVAKNGVELKIRARVTVRTNLQQLIGGATEETIIARVGEGIVTSIGSASSYKDVLENPDNISKVVLQKGLDSGTAFEILSIDIADVDVGENVGAKLQEAQDAASLFVQLVREGAGDRLGLVTFSSTASVPATLGLAAAKKMELVGPAPFTAGDIGAITPGGSTSIGAGVGIALLAPGNWNIIVATVAAASLGAALELWKYAQKSS